MAAQATREKLAGEIGDVKLRDLAAHHLRGALFVVAAGASLLDVAVAVAADDVAQVREWLDDGTLRRSADDDLATWRHDGCFSAVVLQPYVLVQPG